MGKEWAFPAYTNRCLGLRPSCLRCMALATCCVRVCINGIGLGRCVQRKEECRARAVGCSMPFFLPFSFRYWLMKWWGTPPCQTWEVWESRNRQANFVLIYRLAYLAHVDSARSKNSFCFCFSLHHRRSTWSVTMAVPYNTCNATVLKLFYLRSVCKLLHYSVRTHLLPWHV